VKFLETPKIIEETLFQMVSDGQIKAKINSEQQTIAFTDTASTGSKANEEARESEYLEVIEELEGQNKRIIELMDQMEKVSYGIKNSQDYIKRTILNAKDVSINKEDIIIL
jgi:hypothetical protein